MIPQDQIFAPGSAELNLTKRNNCEKAVKGCDVVIHIAADVGCIAYNDQYPGKIFYDNIIMGVELIEAARKEGVEKFVSIGTPCAYPKVTAVPFREEDFWMGYPDEITGPYGLAKKMLLVQGQCYKKQYGFNSIFLILTNLYGPKDHFGTANSHVVPELIRKIVDARDNRLPSVAIWGTGKATREFLYVEDAAEGIVLATEKCDVTDPINVGTGKETSIAELARKIAKLCNFDGEIVGDDSKPDGQLRRRLDVSKAKATFGFAAKIPLDEGLKRTVEWFLDHRQELD
jgi:GDP-L-fucose synthase